MRTVLTAFAVVLSIALVVIGCSNGDGDSQQPQVTPTPVATSAPTTVSEVAYGTRLLEVIEDAQSNMQLLTAWRDDTVSDLTTGTQVDSATLQYLSGRWDSVIANLEGLEVPEKHSRSHGLIVSGFEEVRSAYASYQAAIATLDVSEVIEANSHLNSGIELLQDGTAAYQNE